MAISATRVAFLALMALKLKNNQNLCKLISNGQENTTKLQKIQNLPFTAFILAFMTLFWPFVGFSEFYDAKQGQMCTNCHNHAKYALLEFLNKIFQKWPLWKPSQTELKYFQNLSIFEYLQYTYLTLSRPGGHYAHYTMNLSTAITRSGLR